MRIKFLVRVVIILAALLSAEGEAAAREFRNISTSAGLSDLVVNAICKDSNGYVWFGTGVAVDRFDGSRIMAVPVPGDNAVSRRVNAVCEAAGKIFVGNGTGLFSVSGEGEAARPELSDRISFGVNSLYPSGGLLYIGTERGLFIYDAVADTVAHVLPHNDIMSRGNAVAAITGDGADGLWLASSDGLLHYSGGVLERYPLGRGMNSALTDVKRVGDRVFVGTADNGLLQFDSEHGVFDSIRGLEAHTVTSLGTDSDGRLYVGTDGDGVLVYSTEKEEVEEHLIYDRNNPGSALQSNSVYSLLCDDAGLLWVGHYQSGVDYTPGTRSVFEVYRRDGLDTYGMTVRSLAIDGPERLIGTRDGLYFYNEATGQTASFRVPQLRGNMIFALHKAGPVYYVGVYNGGLCQFDPRTLKISDVPGLSPADNTLRNGTVFDITADESGACFFATSNGVYRYENGRQTAHYTESNSHLPAGNVYEIFFDSMGRGWFCTETGIALYSNGTLRSEGFPKGFINGEKIREVYEDAAHNLFFVPDKGPVFMSNAALTKFGPVDNRRLNTASTFVVEDGGSRRWISSNYGLLRYDGNDNVRIYNGSDGLPSPVFTLCKPVIDADGTIWFGNTQGLVSYAAGTHDDGAVQPVRISGVYADDRPVPVMQADSLSTATIGNASSVAMVFSDPDFTAPENHTYEYRLDGVDNGWQLLIGKSGVRYYSLSPGRYFFRVRRPGLPGSENSMILEVERPVNMLSVILIIGIIIAGAAAVYFLWRYVRSRRELPALPERRSASVDSEKYRTSKLTEKECRSLSHRLDDLMEQKRLFTDPELKIADIATALGTTSHAMSYFFNQYLKKSYPQYINELRVEEFKKMVKTGDLSRLTLSAISERCGFSSRASFFRHFKNMTGITPNEYIQNHSK